jgi:hypothetical protein
MRGPRRPPSHPLVELAYDLRVAVDRALSDDVELAAPRAQVYHRLQEALRSVRRLVDALEQLVDGLEVQSREDSRERPDHEEGSSDDFQIIQVSNQ